MALFTTTVTRKRIFVVPGQIDAYFGALLPNAPRKIGGIWVNVSFPEPHVHGYGYVTEGEWRGAMQDWRERLKKHGDKLTLHYWERS